MTGYALSAVGSTAAILLALWLLVEGIDRLDRWARTERPDLRIIVAEHDTSEVVAIDGRKAS